jgi:hypothetical protein
MKNLFTKNHARISVGGGGSQLSIPKWNIFCLISRATTHKNKLQLKTAWSEINISIRLSSVATCFYAYYLEKISICSQYITSFHIFYINDYKDSYYF